MRVGLDDVVVIGKKPKRKHFLPEDLLLQEMLPQEMLSRGFFSMTTTSSMSTRMMGPKLGVPFGQLGCLVLI